MRFDVVPAAIVIVIVAIVIGAGCSDGPAANRFVVAATVNGEDDDGADVETVVAFDEVARGEWWTCDLHLTSDACVDVGGGDARHVSAFVGLPIYDDIGELGGARCVDEIGPSGVYEIMAATKVPLQIPADVSAFVVVASDVDGDGLLDTDRPDELRGTATVVDGIVEVFEVGAFDQPLKIRITGTTAAGDDVVIDFSGPMQALGDPPPLAAKDSCG